MKKEALLYKKLDNRLVSCYLCCHGCEIADGKFGFCGVRQNIGGVLYTYAYANPAAVHIDPVEKKPLYHFFPGSSSLSIATIGCNFRCGFCQNWDISQRSFRDDSGLNGNREFLPEDLVRLAQEKGCSSISYTYSEPTVFFEYALETAKLAKGKGIYNNFVTNGYMTKEALEMIKPYLDTANVDLKFFSDQSYHRICSGSLQPVLNSIRLMKEFGIWVELTTLIVPGENDSEKELEGIAGFIADLDKNIPWHISRFHPDYKFIDYKPTPAGPLKKAEELGRQAGIKYVYIGNVSGLGNNTYCYNCKNLLIKRQMFDVIENHLKASKCAYCGEPIAGVFINR